MKISLLKVSKEILEKYSAESIETSREMVNGLSEIYKDSNIYIAVTGVASVPGDGYAIIKNVGDVFICVKVNSDYYEYEININNNGRNEIRYDTVSFIINCIYQLIKNKY